MNGIENQENSDSGFYYSLSTNFQADSLFGIDTTLSTELFFGETPPSSLSPDAAQRISPQSTGASNLDDGLRTPEPQSFPSDDYNDNCTMLNHHLVSDVNPSLQVASHVASDLPSIDSELIETQCNGTEIGKSYSPRHKDMDITFYSNLECIPEIPGISPLKALDSNTDNPMKSLEELFEDNKDVNNISNDNNIVSSELGLQSSYEFTHQKILSEVSSLPDHKANNSFGHCLINDGGIHINNPAALVETVKESNAHATTNPLKMQCNYSQTFESIAQHNVNADIVHSFGDNKIDTGSVLEKISNDSDGVNSNSNPLEISLDIKNTLSSDSSLISKNDDQNINMQEAAESVDAISAAELAICQMLDAITDPPNQNVSVVSNDSSALSETVEHHILPSIENKFNYSPMFCESSELNMSHVSITPKHICEEETVLQKTNKDISCIPSNNSITNLNGEKLEYFPSSEECRIQSSASVGIVAANLSTINNLECYVYLEKLDNDFIRRWSMTKKISRGSLSPKKQKENYCSSKHTAKVSSHVLSRRRSRCRSSKKQKINYYPPDYNSKTPAAFINRTLPRRRYRCSVCKRVYSSPESLEIHKCRKGERAKLITTASLPAREQCLPSPICNNFVVGIESQQCEQELEHQSTQQFVDPDQRNTTYKLDESCIRMPENKDTSVTEQCDKEPPPFFCQKCSQVFRDQSLLIQHLCYMHSTQFTKCDICKLKFDRDARIRNHMLLHANNKAYCCQLCSFASSFQAGLERHMWAHHTPHDIRVIEGESVTDSSVLAKLKPCSVVLEALPISGTLFDWH